MTKRNNIVATRNRNIQALLKKATEQLDKIRIEYDKSLHSKSISAELQIDVKNLCENMRSVLDYLAHDIYETQCSEQSPKHRIYFPILSDEKTFNTKINRTVFFSKFGRTFFNSQ